MPSAIAYCASIGLRLPTSDEISPYGAYTGSVTPCSSVNWTWTSTPDTSGSYTYTVVKGWDGVGINYTIGSSTGTVLQTRCVK